MDLNVIILTGGVGQDPVRRETSTGKTVASFSIANERGYGDNKKTTWFNCTAWGKDAEFVINYVKKGSRLRVVGEMKIDKNGDKIYPGVNVSEVNFESSRGQKGESSKPKEQKTEDQPLFDECHEIPNEPDFY